MQTTENPIYALVAGYMFSGETHLDKHLAQVTLKYISNFNSMTVERMAELCQVSVSTYLRFCKKLGYSSFTEFRVRIVDALGKYKFLNTPFSRSENFTSDTFFEQSKDIIDTDFYMLQTQIDPVVCQHLITALGQYDLVFIVDLFYSTVRFALHSDLAVTGKNVHVIHPNGCMESMRAAGLDKNSLIFFVYDGTSRTLDITPAIASCKKYGCHISIMTCQEHFPHDDLCDDIIVTGKASSAVSSIMIHDLVFQYLSTLYREKFM